MEGKELAEQILAMCEKHKNEDLGDIVEKLEKVIRG